MLKGTVYKIEDSNIANLGSKLEKEVREESARHEPAWKGAGEEVGLKIWRINNFKVEEVEKKHHGEFYTGDSYIVLHTYKKPDAPKLLHDIHFWLGTYTTQDEAGTAAYKTVELDIYLGGAPVEYREVQGYESERFHSYFPRIRILDGGVKSGFHHVERQKEKTRLLHIKGRTKAHALEVPINREVLNNGDVFVLITDDSFVALQGSRSGPAERRALLELHTAHKGERPNLVDLTISEVDDITADSSKYFWQYFGVEQTHGRPPKIHDAAEAESDAKAQQRSAHLGELWRLSDASGKLEFTEVAKGDQIKRSQLDSNDAFILFTGAEVFAWIGNKASRVEKATALSVAQNFVAEKKLPPQTSVARVLEGGENEVFEVYFH